MKNLFKLAIDMTKESARINDSPVAIFVNDGKAVISILAVEDKNAIKLALYSLVKSLNLSEIVFINECFYISSIAKTKEEAEEEVKSLPVSKNPARKEAFVVSYFSKDDINVEILPFIRGDPAKDKGNINSKGEILVWDKLPVEFSGGELKNLSSSFNPFQMSEQEAKTYAILAECEIIRKEGSKERINLQFNFRIDVFRHNGKAFFEVVNNKGQVFETVHSQKDNEEFQKKLDLAIELLRIGGDVVKDDL